MDSSGWLELVEFKTCEAQVLSWNPNFFLNLFSVGSDLQIFPNSSREEGGGGLVVKDLPERKKKRSKDLTNLKREKGEDLVDHKDLEISQSFLKREKGKSFL